MNNKLKVIQLIDSLTPGGAEMMALNIANGLAEKGIASYLCATRLEGTLKAQIDPSVKYVCLHKKSRIDVKAFKKLYKFIKQQKISIIHAHSSSYFIAFIMKFLVPSVKIVWHNHYGNSSNLPWVKKIPLLLISKTFFAIISVNKELHEWSKNNFNCKKNAILYNFPILKTAIKNTTILKGEIDKRIVCLANLRPEKDHLNLLKAYLIVKKTLPAWTLHFIGADNQDACSKEIKKFIKAYTLENDVFLYGSCSDTAHILEQATIGVLSSQSEGLPVALLEYGLANLPVVVTDVGECSTVVHHKKSALVVSPKNYKELATMIITLIENKDLRGHLGEKLQKTIQENYSKNTYMKALLDIYKFEA